jgi:hypothetical protein
MSRRVKARYHKQPHMNFGEDKGGNAPPPIQNNRPPPMPQPPRNHYLSYNLLQN